MVQDRRGAAFRRLRPLAVLQIHVILLGLFDFLVYTVVSVLNHKHRMSRFPLVGDSVFLFITVMLKLVSSEEAALTLCSSWFPVQGSSIFVILLTMCLLKASIALYYMFI